MGTVGVDLTTVWKMLAKRMFKWLRRWKVSRDFEVYLSVWLQNNQEIVQHLLDEMNKLNSYKSFIEEVVEGASIANHSFLLVTIYYSSILLPVADEDDLNIFEECIRQKTYDNIPYVFWLIFHFLSLGALHLEKGELTKEAFVFGRDKIIEFFVDRGMTRDLVLNYFVKGLLEYHSIVREVVGKKD